MAKLRQLKRILVLLPALALAFSSLKAQNGYLLKIKGVDKKQSFFSDTLQVPDSFPSISECTRFLYQLPAKLHSMGYVTASLDSVRFDSDTAYASIYVGETYSWEYLKPSGIDESLLFRVGWRETEFEGSTPDFGRITALQELLLDELANTGYPFARVYLDSMRIENGRISALLKLDRGPLYTIDSIQVFGDARVSAEFLQRYLGIGDGGIYNQSLLNNISARLAELPYLEEERPSNLILLGEGSVLNLYLKHKRSSQVNVLVGFLPNNDQLSDKKLLVTGEAHILLRNALGQGETIGLNWEQLQVKSPRLNLEYQHPYVFQSPVGIDFSFGMFRKDSAFLNVQMRAGVQYIISARQSGTVFLQRFSTIVNGVNTNYIIQNKSLPEEADLAAWNLGVDYEYNNTGYRLNPRNGNELRIVVSAGTKQLKKNNAILELKDPSDPGFDFATLYDTVKLKTYQFRLTANAARYFPIGRQSAIKTGIQGGMFQSGNIYRNELFQIGGYRLLRGFDEQSQYLSHYAIATLEYRYLIGRNSFFYAFTDGGWGKNASSYSGKDYGYFGTGLGLALDTRNSVFNLALAVGRRSDAPLNLRQAKIHFGFVNYF